jgi:uncharacterized protein YdiU (UPF0061 family)
VFTFDNTYARDLTGLYAAALPDPAPRPRLIALNLDLAAELGIDPTLLRAEAADLLSGARLPDGAEPIAQAYAGHQFGGLSPQLGDGRALLLGELIDQHGRRRDLQLKGSGRTPFSRGGDGKAALGPMLREYVIGEAMHALGIPTTRALAVVATGQPVRREGMLPGAVLARVAASHLRVGTFEYFAIREDYDRLRRLLDYALDRHYPDVDRTQPALALLTAVRDAQAKLVARWMGVGFIHGVMNTDNVTISGETIDYGPCAFMDDHAPSTVFSSIDHGGRYAYGNQPAIMAWNLSRLAISLLPLVEGEHDEAVAQAQAVLDGFAGAYQTAWQEELGAKLGLTAFREGDGALLREFMTVLEAGKPDHTLTFRHLATAARGDDGPLLALFDDETALRAWLPGWRARLSHDGRPEERAAAMDAVNPLYVPRNHKVEEALTAASEADDLGPFGALLEAVSQPFTEREGLEAFAGPASAAFTTCYKTFCGT